MHLIEFASGACPTVRQLDMARTGAQRESWVKTHRRPGLKPTIRRRCLFGMFAIATCTPSLHCCRWSIRGSRIRLPYAARSSPAEPKIPMDVTYSTRIERLRACVLQRYCRSGALRMNRRIDIANVYSQSRRCKKMLRRGTPERTREVVRRRTKMALKHAKPDETVDLRPLGEGLTTAKTHTTFCSCPSLFPGTSPGLPPEKWSSLK